MQQFVEPCGIESGLLADIERFFLELAPADRPWLHNDLHLRPGIPPDEPRNAHSHLIALMLGNHLPGGVAGGSGWPALPGSAAAVERCSAQGAGGLIGRARWGCRLGIQQRHQAAEAEHHEGEGTQQGE